eukprot:TRINITY_DN1762_c0_g1_i4.p1 TRINITY_DN1762_c0_g1~~TRINITY_DN1762_c0_g1_i4.p1  ORF type:complete len:304 (+),score=42.34 TRINITY_DN1762_c0_g1_i4:22-912(+)
MADRGNWLAHLPLGIVSSKDSWLADELQNYVRYYGPLENRACTRKEYKMNNQRHGSDPCAEAAAISPNTAIHPTEEVEHRTRRRINESKSVDSGRSDCQLRALAAARVAQRLQRLPLSASMRCTSVLTGAAAENGGNESPFHGSGRRSFSSLRTVEEKVESEVIHPVMLPRTFPDLEDTLKGDSDQSPSSSGYNSTSSSHRSSFTNEDEDAEEGTTDFLPTACCNSSTIETLKTLEFELVSVQKDRDSLFHEMKEVLKCWEAATDELAVLKAERLHLEEQNAILKLCVNGAHKLCF